MFPSWQPFDYGLGAAVWGLSAVWSAARTAQVQEVDRKSTRLNSSHMSISYAVFCLKKKRFYLLDFNWITSILLASLLASHTLIAYPIVSKLGIAKTKAVNITVGGTMITDTLALLVLAVIAGMSTGEINNEFWIRLVVSIIFFFTVAATTEIYTLSLHDALPI